MQFPSKLIDDAVNAFAKFPGIGKKSALRMVVYLLQKDTTETESIAEALLRLRREIQFCTICHNVSDTEVCSVCSNTHRDKSTICVVENFRDIIAIENTKNYNGVYHVLEGLISPLDGIGPDKLNIPKLMERIRSNEIKEVIMALNPTLDGDTTIFYLSKLLADTTVKITTIARGISFGGELEYVDEITLSRSLQARLPYERYLSK